MTPSTATPVIDSIVSCLYFFAADFLSSKSGHRPENQRVLRPDTGVHLLAKFLGVGILHNKFL